MTKTNIELSTIHPRDLLPGTYFSDTDMHGREIWMRTKSGAVCVVGDNPGDTVCDRFEHWHEIPTGLVFDEVTIKVGRSHAFYAPEVREINE